MHQIAAYSAFALTVSLAVTRPRIGRHWQIGPAQAASASVMLLFAAGVVHPQDLTSAAQTLWRPFITIVSIMVTTAAAHRVGVLNRLGAMIFSRTDVSVARLFGSVFALTALTSSILNNDAAVLLLTPLVLTLVRERFPNDRNLLVPFAFAVFTAVGVAPFVVSNPMNMIVASYAGLNFNQYAGWMIPIALCGWLIAFVILRLVFRAQLASRSTVLRGHQEAGPTTATKSEKPASPPGVDASLNSVQRRMLGLLLLVVGSYPVVALFNGDAIWIVSAAGAAVAVTLARRSGGVSARHLLVHDVAWDILVFLLAVFVLAIGLRNVGLVDRLASLYAGAGVGLIGTVAAVGSATLNNHPMAIINMLALDSTPGTGLREILAVLIGGDLGPRLLPIGSLAGLLWLEACRRQKVEVSVRQFIKVGLMVTTPTLAASLLILALR